MPNKIVKLDQLSHFFAKLKLWLPSVYATKSELPTKTSDLTNDSGFVADASYVHTDNNFTNADKAAIAAIPSKTSDLTNDSDFQTGTEVDASIAAAISGITSFDFQIVQTLPATGEKGVIYLVPKTGSGSDVYDEYIWVTPSGGTAKFEKIGSTDVDLSQYVTYDSTNDEFKKNGTTIAQYATDAEVDALFS